METHDDIEVLNPQNEIQPSEPAEMNDTVPEPAEIPQETLPDPQPSEAEWREMIRRAEEEGYRRGLNERASAIMAEPAPYEQVSVAPKTQEEIPFLKTIRRSVWDD